MHPDKETFPRAVTRYACSIEAFLLGFYVALRLFAVSGGEVPPELPAARAIVFALLLTALLRVTITGRVRYVRSRLLFALALYTLVTLGAALAGLHRSMGMERFWLLVEICAVIGVLSLWEKPDEAASLALASLPAAGSAVILYALFQKFVSLPQTVRFVMESAAEGPAALPWGRERLLAGEPFGPFVTSNILAGFLLFILPLFVAVAFVSFASKRKYAAGVASTLLAAGIVYLMAASGSRGALAGLIAALPASAIAYRCKDLPAKFFWCIVGGSVVLAAAAAALAGPLSSMGIRGGYWLGGTRALIENPLGIGPGAFGVVYPRYKPLWAMEVQTLHSAFVNALVTGGPMLLVVFLYLLHRLHRGAHISVRLPSASPDEIPGTEPSSAGNREKDGDGEKAASSSRDDHTRRLFATTCGIGLVGGWLFTATRYFDMGGAYLLEMLDEFSASSLLKTLLVLVQVPVMLGIFGLFRWLSAGKRVNEGGVSSNLLMPLAFMVGTTGFFVHSSVEMLWEVPALVACVLLLGWSLEKRGSIRAKDLAPPARILTAAVAAFALSAGFVLLVVRPSASAEALRTARLAGSSLGALSEIEKTRREKAPPPEAAIEQIVRVLPLELRRSALSMIAHGKTEPLEQWYQKIALDQALTASRRAPADDRVAEASARVLLEASSNVRSGREELLREADALFRQAMLCVPHAARYWSLGGRISAERGRRGQALARFFAATRYYPASPLKWIACGDAALLAGPEWHLHAGEFYQRALQLNTSTLDEKISLYTLVYHPDRITWPKTGGSGGFQLMLSAVIQRRLEKGLLDGAGPILFRAGLEDLRMRNPDSAEETFRSLSEYYTGPEKISMKVFVWSLMLMRNKAGDKTARLENELREALPHPAILDRLHRRIEEAARWRNHRMVKTKPKTANDQRRPAHVTD